MSATLSASGTVTGNHPRRIGNRVGRRNLSADFFPPPGFARKQATTKGGLKKGQKSAKGKSTQRDRRKPSLNTQTHSKPKARQRQLVPVHPSSKQTRIHSKEKKKTMGHAFNVNHRTPVTSSRYGLGCSALGFEHYMQCQPPP